MGTPERARYIYLYANSEQQKKHFAELANAAGVPLSKFLLAKIEEGLAEKPTNRTKEVETLRGQVALLQEEIRLKDLALQQSKMLIERKRNLTWLDDDAEILDLSIRLVDALKEHGPIFETRLLQILGVDATDLALTKAIAAQLELLERHGKVRKGGRGWIWI